MHVNRLPPNAEAPVDGASARTAPAAGLLVATVVATDGPELTVALDGRPVPARRAVSCLVDPAVADRVLLLSDERIGLRVLAVLDRDEAAALSLSGGGRALSLAAPDLTLRADRNLALAAPDTTLHSRRVTARVGEASLVGKLVDTAAETLKVVASSLHCVAERWSASLGTSTRVVQDTDTVQARNMVYQGSETVILRGARTAVSAVDDVVVTGSRISMT